MTEDFNLQPQPPQNSTDRASTTWRDKHSAEPSVTRTICGVLLAGVVGLVTFAGSACVTCLGMLPFTQPLGDSGLMIVIVVISTVASVWASIWTFKSLVNVGTK